MDSAKGKNVRASSFWVELEPREHAVQVYRNDAIFMDALEGFASAGLRRGESVILISTASHLHELEKRLRANWLDVDRARWEERYIALLAQETLEHFMVDGMPDANRFQTVIRGVLAQARGPSGRTVRAFGEMVAVLWAEGKCAAAIALETLWNKLQEDEHFPLFCAYPHADMGDEEALRSVCAQHSRIIPGYA